MLRREVTPEAEPEISLVDKITTFGGEDDDLLDIAIKHERRIKRKMLGIWFQDKYKYWNFSTYFENTKLTTRHR